MSVMMESSSAKRTRMRQIVDSIKPTSTESYGRGSWVRGQGSGVVRIEVVVDS